MQLTFIDDPALPVIISSGYASLTPNEFFTYTINSSACGGGTASNLIGPLPAGLTFDAATGTISGIYTGPLRASSNGGSSRPELAGGTVLGNIQLFGTNSQGTGTFPLLFLAAPSGVLNIATRLLVGTGDNVLIGGFIVTGNAPKVVLVRALGPTLANFGVPNALQDPVLRLQDSAGHLVVNDNWKSDQEQFIQETNLSPQSDLESAIIIGLDPGNYTAIVEGRNGATGTGLVEVYDLGTAPLSNSGVAKLGDISTRGFVDTGDSVMIGGFIIKRVATRVVVRGIGPSLTPFGVVGALADPVIEVHGSSGELLATNDNWNDAATRQQIIDSGLAPTNDLESALWGIINPGALHGRRPGQERRYRLACSKCTSWIKRSIAKLANIPMRSSACSLWDLSSDLPS